MENKNLEIVKNTDLDLFGNPEKIIGDVEELNYSDFKCEDCEVRAAENMVEGKMLCSLCEHSTAAKIEEYNRKKNKIETGKMPTEKQKEIDDRRKEYSKKLHGEKEVRTESEEVEHSNDMRFLLNRIKFNKNNRPDSISYAKVKKLFWKYYRALILESTGNEPVFSDDGNEAWFTQRFVKWLIGETDEEEYFPKNPEGLFDPNKSLYISGKIGTGKSTFTKTGFHVMARLSNQFDWRQRKYDFKSLNKIYSDVYLKKSFSELSKVYDGFFCLDELRAEHLEYKHFGQDLKMINDLLSRRYDLWDDERTNTLITSNIPESNLGDELNDPRLLSRMKQQYTFVELKGNNKRKL